MKFAYLIMGGFRSAEDHAAIHGGQAQIVGVDDLQEACAVAKKLRSEGVDCIELCGAFGPDGARAVMDATEHKLPIGYVTHLPEMDAVYQAAFSRS